MKKNKLIRNLILLFLFILIVYFVYKLLYAPKMTLIIKYKDVPPIIQTFPRASVEGYYRGLNIGKVSKITLSEDQKYIVFYLDIYYKNLRLPKNIKIILGSEDLYGARHLSLYYPNNPSSQLLSNGDTVYGTATYDRLDKYLVKELEEGKLKKIVTNLDFLTNYLSTALKKNNNKELNQFLTSVKESGINASFILNEVRDIIGDPQTKKDIKSTLRYSSESLEDINQIMKNNKNEINHIIDKAPESIDKTIANLETVNINIPRVNTSILKANENIFQANKNIPEANRTITTTNSLLYSTNCNLGNLNSKIPVIPPIPPNLFKNADNTLGTFNCLGTELNEILSKRFLLFRFMFGKLGNYPESCRQDNSECPNNTIMHK